MKTTVIHHSADFDGIFCREIARKFLPDAELIGWDFANPKLHIIDYPGKIYILDLSPDCFDLPIFDDETWARIVWIDHHKSSIEKFDPTIPGYRIDGVAACRLAWQWFDDKMSCQDQAMLPGKQEYIDRNVREPYAVRLAGEYDIWDKRDPRADVFQFGLRSKELSEEDWKWLLTVADPYALGEYDLGMANTTVSILLANGELLQRYQQSNDASIVNHRSFLVEFEGLKFLTLNTPRCNSLTFAARDVPETGHDALMAFYWNGKVWTFSLYHARHNTGIDLSKIAVKHGGGGHRGACGFISNTLPFIS